MRETPKQWFRLIETYTASELTFQSDKLEAIGGLVQRLESQTKQRFVRGLWQDRLHECLLWIRASGQSLERIPGSEVPSWSWAGWKGAVGHVALNTEYAINKGLTYSEKASESGLNSVRLRASTYTLNGNCVIVMEQSANVRPPRPPQLLRYNSTISEVRVNDEYIGWILLDEVEDNIVEKMEDILGHLHCGKILPTF